MEPTGYSFSQKGTKFRLAARTIGSTSGTPKNTTSFPRDCSFRASAVIGFRCPATGRLTKPIFILALPARRLDGPRHLAKATMHGPVNDEPVFRQIRQPAPRVLSYFFFVRHASVTPPP